MKILFCPHCGSPAGFSLHFNVDIVLQTDGAGPRFSRSWDDINDITDNCFGNGLECMEKEHKAYAVCHNCGEKLYPLISGYDDDIEDYVDDVWEGCFGIKDLFLTAEERDKARNKINLLDSLEGD